VPKGFFNSLTSQFVDITKGPESMGGIGFSRFSVADRISQERNGSTKKLKTLLPDSFTMK
jgi:hypothetical protein